MLLLLRISGLLWLWLLGSLKLNLLFVECFLLGESLLLELEEVIVGQNASVVHHLVIQLDLLNELLLMQQ